MALRRGKRGWFRHVILLDTNVISALMQNVPDRHVMRWLDRQPVSDIWLPSVVVFELRYGLGILPAGLRRLRVGHYRVVYEWQRSELVFLVLVPSKYELEDLFRDHPKVTGPLPWLLIEDRPQ